ncbi:hypothetical protein NBRC116595_07310 [Aliiglaciecola sp. NS0011-25]
MIERLFAATAINYPPESTKQVNQFFVLNHKIDWLPNTAKVLDSLKKGADSPLFGLYLNFG